MVGNLRYEASYYGGKDGHGAYACLLMPVSGSTEPHIQLRHANHGGVVRTSRPVEPGTNHPDKDSDCTHGKQRPQRERVHPHPQRVILVDQTQAGRSAGWHRGALRASRRPTDTLCKGSLVPCTLALI
jgi:hypothetical protein